MKAYSLDKTGFRLVERPVPACGPGQVLVKSTLSGLCEGDLFAYRTARSGGPIPKPDGMGHEGAGVVAEVGAGVSGFKVGDRVADLGNGLFAEYFLTMPSHLALLPEGLPDTLALGEPVACYVHASGRFGIRPGDRVLLLGLGFMGLGCLEMARMQGATDIVAADPIAWRRERGAALGATRTLDPAEVDDSLGVFDVVIEATGVPSAVTTATERVAEHGRIVLVGYHQTENGRREVDMKMWNYKAIDVVNGHVRRGDEKMAAMKRGLSLVGSGHLHLKELTTVYPFADLPQAFADLDARKPGLFKAAVAYD